ncbi:hypothetical protein [Pelagibacterium luteolum]|uniref:Uncharacterized protein n=1 Tax=Pelagibacterium luteolum TaxID=440168 RepID=A0A1G7S9Q7_9HYPH|nr:hypothetical protein [Pelagibacterium luteolum]SDG18910.1 hypothetical protein SAMN04487974_101346 [Pelagibacterium luteolum]
MATQQNRTGLLDMMGQGDSGFANWLNPRRNAIMGFGAGLVGHDTAKGRMAGAVQGMMQGREQDTAYQTLQQEQADRQQAVLKAAGAMRERGYGDIADFVEQGGMDPQTGWTSILRNMSDRTAGNPFELRTVGDSLLRVNTATGEFDTIFAGSQAPTPTDTQRNLEWRAAQAGLAPGTPEYQQFMLSGGSGGTSLSVTPDGGVTFSQGGGTRPLTEQQSKDAVYATRAAGALGTLNEYDTELTNFVQGAMGNDPTGLIRGQQSAEYQVADVAGREFLAAILRKDSGAAIQEYEMQNYGAMFLPRPGDTPATIEYKRLARQRAQEALEAGMSPQAIINQENALRASGGTAPFQVNGQPQPGGAGGSSDPLGIR